MSELPRPAEVKADDLASPSGSRPGWVGYLIAAVVVLVLVLVVVLHLTGVVGAGAHGG